MIRHPERAAVLADSQATLRQVSGLLRDFDGEDEPAGRPEIPAAVERLGPDTLMSVLLDAYRELVGVIETLRSSRGALHKAALERLHRTHEKLQEVTSTTELAASDMLDGLDRALGLVEELEAEKGDAPSKHGELREELHGLISLLQFQDITSQQLGYASGVLLDVEQRLLAVRDVLSLGGAELQALSDARAEMAERDEDLPERPASTHAHCDPNASTADADDRQALADAIFGSSAGS